MKLLVQRVDSAKVSVNNKIISEIERGLLVFVGFSKDFEEEKLEWGIRKILNLRLWESEKKGFDLSVSDIKGEIMIVSQFTLFGNVFGNKPNFSNAMDYENAKKNYDKFISSLKKSTNLKIEQGIFGEMMNVELINNGPVTIILEK